MAMGRRKPKQQPMFMAATEIVKPASHPFYKKVNEILGKKQAEQLEGKE